MMNMTEFVNEMMKAIPSPETIQQEIVQRITEEMINDLRQSGRAEYVWERGEGGRIHCWQVCNRIAQIFNARGYIVKHGQYSENNHDKYCWLTVKLP